MAGFRAVAGAHGRGAGKGGRVLGSRIEKGRAEWIGRGGGEGNGTVRGEGWGRGAGSNTAIQTAHSLERTRDIPRHNDGGGWRLCRAVTAPTGVSPPFRLT